MLTLEEVLSDVSSSPNFRHLSNVDINSRGKEGESPLHWMAFLGDDKAIKLLIEAGSNIDFVDNQGNSPLHEAVVNRQTSSVNTLIKLGANRNLRNKNGLTPLDIAKADNFEPIIITLNS
ncbi:MAG: ankyrin repeat domain-containing protein [Methyloglobulus sp.]